MRGTSTLFQVVRYRNTCTNEVCLFALEPFFPFVIKAAQKIGSLLFCVVCGLNDKVELSRELVV